MVTRARTVSGVRFGSAAGGLAVKAKASGLLELLRWLRAGLVSGPAPQSFG